MSQFVAPALPVDYVTLPEIPCPVCDGAPYCVVTRRFDDGRVVQCSACGHIYLNPALPDAVLEEIYEGYHARESEEELLGGVEAFFADTKGPYQGALRLVEARGGLAGRRVLEVGCGPGRFLAECRRRGADVTGVDPSPAAVRLARERFGLEVIPAMFEDAVARSLLPNAGYDLVFAFELIEHVRRPADFLRQVNGLLKPGGLVCLSTPNFELFRLMGVAAPVVHQWQEHLHFFDHANLAGCVRRAGFAVEELRCYLPLDYAERQKQIISFNGPLNRLWQGVRWLPPARWAKNGMLRLLGRRRQAIDVEEKNGRGLLCLARKPADA